MTEPGGTPHYGLQAIKPVAQLAALLEDARASTEAGLAGRVAARHELLDALLQAISPVVFSG